MGFAPAANPVTFATPPGGTPAAADFRWGEFYQKALSWTNTSAARFEGVDISTDGNPGPEETRWVFLPKTPEWFSHDTDGNLLSDGKWLYTWDGENRLIAMETSASLPAAMPPVRLEFVYDYMSRRCVKRLFDKSGEGAAAVAGSAVVEGSAAAVVQSDEEPVAPESGGGVVIPIGWTLTSTFKYVWDGWNLLAELDGEDGVLRTCAWGLDLSGSEQGAGGVGGLVFQYLSKPDTTYHLFYDGNGNVTSLRDDGGTLSCEYVYGPFGETLTARGDEGALAYNAFKFSTKYADAESGLLYYGYRYYNPGTGRWLNRDPIEEDGGVTLVAFAANAPLTYFDPLGTDFIAVADRPVGGTAGAFHHYSVQYWSTDCNPDVGVLLQVANVRSAKKVESVELLRDGGWQAYRWRPGLLQFIHSGDWLLTDVAVSTIHYSDSGVRLIPIYVDTKAAEVSKRWGFVLSQAREYEFAEQALPLGVGTRTEWRHWAQSEYRIGDRFNNSNTFVREVLRRAQLPMYEMPGSHPGLVTARRVPPPYKYGTTPFKGTPPPPPTFDGGALGVGYD